MTFPGCSHMASSRIYTHTHTHISLDPPSTTEILSQWNLDLDAYRISRDPTALQESLFPQRVRHSEIRAATRRYAQSSLCSTAQKLWSIFGRLSSKHDRYLWHLSGADATCIHFTQESCGFWAALEEQSGSLPPKFGRSRTVSWILPLFPQNYF